MTGKREDDDVRNDVRNDVRKIALVAILMATARCWASSYYVSSSGGNDSNNGTSAATAWQTLGKVNGRTFSAGDVIYLKRGDLWNEQLVAPSSGASGNPIQFDAYGTGAAPVITAAAPVTFVSGSWSYVSGNTWKATVSTGIGSPTISMVQFGKLYGNRKTGSCTSVISSKYDWCVIWPYLYVAGIESMLTSKSGIEKKDAAMMFLQNAIGMTDAIASREIVQPEQFKNGISQIIDGVVLCMNASTWAKGKPAVPVAEAH
jgi:hypothetical protein